MKAKGPKMGRPTLPAGEAREVVFTLRLSDAEKDEIAEAARRAGQPTTKWARDILLSRARSADTYPALATPQ